MLNKDKTDAWAARLNRLGRSLDEWEQTVHWTAWPNVLKEMREEWREEAKRYP